MKLAWCTDIHLDFLDRGEGAQSVTDFASNLSRVDCDGFLLTGDVSLAENVVRHLQILEGALGRPIYFVLGNHDFYGGSFRDVRTQVRSLCDRSRYLRYMTGSGPVSLASDVALVGDDGWYDALHGDVNASNFLMTDWFKIIDYVNAGCLGPGMIMQRPNIGAVVSLSRKVAFESADRMRDSLRAAAPGRRVVVVMTHVPPWTAAHRHGGKGGSPGANPWYTSRLMGDAIEEVAAEHPGVRFEVFCGHTHGQNDVQVTPNVFCHVGGAEYGNPRVAGTIQIA